MPPREQPVEQPRSCAADVQVTRWRWSESNANHGTWSSSLHPALPTERSILIYAIKILLGNHAQGDHQEGDAAVKQMTGAQTIATAEDVPALQAMKPGGKEHPIDKIIHDGAPVTLGGTTLVAHLTPGHTHGCTTRATTAQEGGNIYNVLFGCSLRPPAVVTPAIADEFNRAFKTVRALPCDVQLGDHPFIDPASCMDEADVEEAMFHALINEQR
jgi:hypothetical protein